MDAAEGINSDAASAAAGPGRIAAPGSTPSTWAGAIVLGSVIGLALIRRSLRRMR